MNHITSPRILSRVPLLFLALLLLSACAKQPTTMQPETVSQSSAALLAERLDPASQNLDSWMDLAPGVAASLKWVSSRPQDKPALDAPWPRVSWAGMKLTLEKLLDVLPRLDDDPQILAREFVWLRIQPDTLLTGYYEPYLEASLTPDPGYPYPIYGLPPDLRRVRNLGQFNPYLEGKSLTYRMGPEGIEPYPDRQAIDFEGELEGKGLEIAWAKDMVDVFFLHIQGSGRLVLPDGTTKHVLYAGKNDRGYVALGKVLVQKGLLEKDKVSMQSIRHTLWAHRDRWPELLSENPNYVFFRLGDQGPYGASGARLTPLASVAVNRSYIPLGALLALDAPLPHYGDETTAINGLMLAQDTGAMKPNHIDLFCGSDPLAAFRAGKMQDTGAVHLLLAREALEME